MAIAIRHRPAEHLRAKAAPLPIAVAGLSLIGPALDLVGQLQHVAVLQYPALLACALAATLQIAALAHRPRAAWLMAAALATGTSVVLRLGGYPEGPALALLGLVALGTGGAFRPARLQVDLVVDAETERSDDHTQDSVITPLPKAA